MTGLILIFILAVWFSFANAISRFVSKSVTDRRLKIVVRSIVFILIFIGPFLDEIIGGIQFKELCSTDAVAIYEEEKVRGKLVISKPLVVTPYTNTILPIYKQTWKYEDPNTHKELILFNELHAYGGWLSRSINFNSVHDPYTFNGVCGGNYRKFFFQELNVKSLN